MNLHPICIGTIKSEYFPVIAPWEKGKEKSRAVKLVTP